MKLYRFAETEGVYGHNYQTVGILEGPSGTLKTIEPILTRLKEGTYRWRKVNDTPSGIFTYMQLFVPGRRDVRLGYTIVDTDQLYTIQVGKEFDYSIELDRLISAPSLQEWKAFVSTLPLEGTLQVVSRLNGTPRQPCLNLAHQRVYALPQETLGSVEESLWPVVEPKRPEDVVSLDILE